MRKFDPTDHIGIYLSDLRYWHQQAKGMLVECDQNARREWTVISYMPYALFLAKRFRARGVDFGDLIQVANMAVIAAVDDFIEGKGKLSNFIAARIRGALWAAVRTQRTCIREPDGGGGKRERVRVTSMNKQRKRGRSELSTLIPQQDSQTPEDTSQLRKLMGVLVEKDRRIIAKRLSGKNRKEVAEEEGVSPQSISNREKRALAGMFSEAGSEYHGETLRELGVVKAHNREGKSLRMIMAFGETKCLAEWCDEMGIANPGMVTARLAGGMSPECALLTPSRRKKAQ